MFARILIPVDGSDCAERAIASGLELAKSLDAEVVFLHVLENPLTAAYPTPVTTAYYSEIYDELKEAARELLESARKRAEEAGVRATARLTEGRDPVQAIHEAEAEVDLVVMGTHGRRGFNRWVFGSVAEGALRRSSKPFLLIRAAGSGGRLTSGD